MNVLNRIIFQVVFFSLVINWIILYVAQRSEPLFNWPVLIVVMLISLASNVLVSRRYHPLMMKAKFNDRPLFIDDLVKAMLNCGFVPSGSVDHHMFFKRTNFFPPQIDVIDVKFLEDNECLITYPPVAAKVLAKHMQPYTLLREREFLKETDKLMERT